VSKRLQVVVDEFELARFQRAAASVGLTMSEWARQTLRRAERGVANGDPETKLAAIRRAAAHRFPTAEIEQMLNEIEGGYLDGGDD
jgi:hypothetical protein